MHNNDKISALDAAIQNIDGFTCNLPIKAINRYEEIVALLEKQDKAVLIQMIEKFAAAATFPGDINNLDEFNSERLRMASLEMQARILAVFVAAYSDSTGELPDAAMLEGFVDEY